MGQSLSHLDDDVEEVTLQIESYGYPGMIFVEVLCDIDGGMGDAMLRRARTLLEG